MQNRFRHTRSIKAFDCYDCRKIVNEGDNICWDNKRNVRICIPCFDKLIEMVGDGSDGSVSKGTTKERVYWDSNMLPTKPWEIGNYDINNWPENIQQEYVALSRSPEQYTKGLQRALKIQATTNIVK